MSVAIQAEVERLNLAEAISFFAVTVHRDAQGNPVPTVTVFAEGVTKEHGDELRAHLQGIADTLRKVYAEV